MAGVVPQLAKTNDRTNKRKVFFILDISAKILFVVLKYRREKEQDLLERFSIL